MVRSFAYVVFVLPVVFTVVFSSLVLIGALVTFERELVMWPGDGSGTGAHDAGTPVLASKYDSSHGSGQATDMRYDASSAYVVGEGTADTPTAHNYGPAADGTVSGEFDVIYGSLYEGVVSAIDSATKGRL